MDSLLLENLNNISESVVSNMEVSWNTENFNEASKPASLLSVQFRLDSFKQIFTRNVSFFFSLNLQQVS